MKKLLLKRAKGQAVLEFALVMPILLLVCFMIITVGMLLYSKIIVVIAASQGARVGSQIWYNDTYSEAEKIEKIEKVVNGVLSESTIRNEQEVVIEQKDDALNVTVDYEYQIILPFVSFLFENSKLSISHKAVYYIEGSGG